MSDYYSLAGGRFVKVMLMTMVTFTMTADICWIFTICHQLWASQVARVVKNPPANAADTEGSGSIPGVKRSSGGRHGNPLQYSCLKNPMDRGAWWATVHGVARLRYDWSNWAPYQTCRVLHYTLNEKVGKICAVELHSVFIIKIQVYMIQLTHQCLGGKSLKKSTAKYV